MKPLHAEMVSGLDVCESTISATRPAPDAAYPYLTHAKDFYPTQPAGIPVPVAYSYDYGNITR